MEVADRIAGLLRDAARPLVPLEQLTVRLQAEEENPADEECLRGYLRSRPDRFIVLERPALFAGAEHWPEEERAAYAAALRAAGFETQALVGAALDDDLADGEGAAASPLTQVATSLAQIADAASPDALLRESLWDALPLAEATMRVLADAWRARAAQAGEA